ncbi:MAG TPA: DUF202 domain-containing protein [Solirubrobacteraceae bacterium]|nr:DUF202 domain-containing protein [Solirubrobacteraceae bacterium]
MVKRNLSGEPPNAPDDDEIARRLRNPPAAAHAESTLVEERGHRRLSDDETRSRRAAGRTRTGRRRIELLTEPRLNEVGEDPDPRFTFANERTFLAWNRTALALIAAGLARSSLW